MSTTVTIVGNVGSDPELRFTGDGTAVASFSLAETSRKKNAQTGEWEDGNTTWFRVSVFGGAAENVAETIRKGMRAIVQGGLENRQYTTDQGEERYSLDVRAYEVGPSLKWAKGQLVKSVPDQGGGQSIQQQGQQQGYGGGAPQGGGDPWGSAPQQGGFGGGAPQGGGGSWDQQAPF